MKRQFKKKLRPVLFSMLTLAMVGGVQAQNNESIIQFFNCERSIMREKLYLHLDKPYYAAGDTIWFRGTLVNADTHSYLVKTNYIYVELLAKNDSVVTRKKLKRDALCYHNYIELSTELPEGDYSLRAYTSWMRNFGEDYFYSHRIHIGNTLRKKAHIASAIRNYHVTFFPEGGELLADVAQQVAFKAQRSDGFSDEVRGAVFTSRGDTIARFSTEHDGMGAITLTAPKGEVLRAVTISLQDGLYREFELPEVKDDAVALHVEHRADGLYYQLLSSGNKPLPAGLRLVVHCRSLLLANEVLESGETSGMLDTKNYPDGILHLILCTDKGQALSRRLVFIANKTEQNVWEFTTDKALYGKREKVHIDFSLHDSLGKPLRGDFSVSVTDSKTITPDLRADHIVSNLLLTSDLKGFVENPAWYFFVAENKEKRMQALDWVMMTHGWSRFDTGYLSNIPHYDLKEPLEVGQYISGTVTGISSKEHGNMVSAYNPDEKEFASDSIHPDGTYCINGLDIPDGRYFSLKLLTKKKSGVKFEVDKPEFPVPTYKEPFIVAEESYKEELKKNYLSDGMKNYMLPDVQVSSKMSSHKALKNLFVRDRFDQTQVRELIDPNRVVTGLDFFDVLATEIYPGKFFHPSYTSYYEANNSMESMPYRPSWGELRRLYIGQDEYNGYESISTALTRIRAFDIDRLEFVVRRGSDPFDTSEYTTMVIYMKDGFSYHSEAPDSRNITVFPLGYTWPAYFYHPVYASPESVQNSKLDVRTTLYWNPSLQTDADGKGEVVFYTSDLPDKYYIVIEGVTFDGRPCRYESMLSDSSQKIK